MVSEQYLISIHPDIVNPVHGFWPICRRVPGRPGTCNMFMSICPDLHLMRSDSYGYAVCHHHHYHHHYHHHHYHHHHEDLWHIFAPQYSPILIVVIIISSYRFMDLISVVIAIARLCSSSSLSLFKCCSCLLECIRHRRIKAYIVISRSSITSYCMCIRHDTDKVRM